MKLIAEWKHSWRYWSVRLNGVGLLLLSICQFISEAWNSMPPDLRAALPWARDVSLFLFAAGLLARLIQQPKTKRKIDGHG